MNDWRASAQAAGDRVRRPLRIVVADHDPISGPLHREALGRWGHHVCAAATGRQLVAECRMLHPDLVISEIELPDMDGIVAAEQICREKPTPIILLLSSEDAGFVRRVLDNPYILACLFKPVGEAGLWVAIISAIDRFERVQSLRLEAAELRQALEQRKCIERAKGMVMKYAGLDEQAACRRLKKLASVQNRQLMEIAQAIAVGGELLQQLEQLPHDGKTENRRARHAEERQPLHQTRRVTVWRRNAPTDRMPAPKDGQRTR